jgi:nucleoside-diphosphate-sugar epimerase
MSRRILVAGASGFIGRPLVQALASDGWTVIGASRKRPERDPGAAEWVEIDLLAEDPRPLAAAAHAEVLVNLAWIATPGVYAESLANLDWLRATTGLTAAFLAAGGRRVVGAGTCLEYDRGEGQGTTGARTLYGAAKHACRLAIERLVAAVEGASLAWARIFFLLGAEDDPSRFAPSLAKSLLGGQPADVSQGLAVRDFIDVRDCARAFAALASGQAAGAFDIATGRALRLRDLAEAIARAVERPDLLRVEGGPGDPPRLVGDPAPLERATDFAPAYALDDSIAALIAHWRERLKA